MWMADFVKSGPLDNHVDQAIIALKKGAYLLKYGRRGKPKFCPFRLSNVEELTHKSQLLEAHLESTSRQLREVTSIAAEETAKCNAAKEVIKSLTTQLKDMAERVPEGYPIDSNSGSNESHASSLLILTSNENKRSNHSATPDATGCASDLLSCNPTKALAEEGERVEQAEPGVYITVSSSPGGETYLKRIRFSRKRFSEQQAEKWWAENRSRIQEKYLVPTGEKSVTSHVSERD